MFVVLVSLAVIISVLLVIVVLVQNSKGGGLSSMFASSNSVMGVRKTTDFLDKATWSLVAILVVLSVASAAFIHSDENVDETTKILNKIEANSPVAPADDEAAPLMPALPAAPEVPAE